MKCFLLILLIVLIITEVLCWIYNQYQSSQAEDKKKPNRSAEKLLKYRSIIYGSLAIVFLAMAVIMNTEVIFQEGIIGVVNQWLNTYLLLIMAVWWILMFPAGELLGLYLKAYYEPKNYKDSGLEKAGKLIGQVERTMVLIFYLGNSLSAIAFQIVAKSILRFKDLKKAEDKDKDGFSISEYIILGSLLSIALGIIGGVTIDLITQATGIEPIRFPQTSTSQS